MALRLNGDSDGEYITGALRFQKSKLGPGACSSTPSLSLSLALSLFLFLLADTPAVELRATSPAPCLPTSTMLPATMTMG